MLTRKDFEDRLAGLKNGRQGLRNDISRLTADLHATDGAIEECEYWLSQLPEEENGQ